MKRVLECATACLALVLLLPLFAVIALAIKLGSYGPVFYTGRRMGVGGKDFHLLKFRSMVQGADKLGPGVTGREDSRVTPLGRVLRYTKMDELPQLINVARGDMSFVGPRPEDPRYLRFYHPDHRKLLDVRPGITSPASLHFIREETLLGGKDWERAYVEEILPHKLDLELAAMQSPSLSRDVRLVLRTLGRLVWPQRGDTGAA